MTPEQILQAAKEDIAKECNHSSWATACFKVANFHSRNIDEACHRALQNQAKEKDEMAEKRQKIYEESEAHCEELVLQKAGMLQHINQLKSELSEARKELATLRAEREKTFKDAINLGMEYGSYSPSELPDNMDKFRNDLWLTYLNPLTQTEAK